MTESQPMTSAPPETPDNKALIVKYRQQYEAADEFSRHVASFRDDVSIPANNELRYAGHHFACAANDDGFLDDLDQLQRAITHCQRAMYEAADSGILSALDMINIFRREYSLVVISETVPNYSEILKDANTAQKHLATTRKHTPDGAMAHERYLEIFKNLEEHCETLDASREDLNKKIAKQIQGNRRFFFNAALAVLGIVIALIALAYTVFAHNGENEVSLLSAEEVPFPACTECISS